MFQFFSERDANQFQLTSCKQWQIQNGHRCVRERQRQVREFVHDREPTLFSRWMGFDQLGFGGGRQIELMDPGGVWSRLQRLFACAWGVESGTTRDRSSAAFGPGNHTLSSRRETYSAMVVLTMQYIGTGRIKRPRPRCGRYSGPSAPS